MVRSLNCTSCVQRISAFAFRISPVIAKVFSLSSSACQREQFLVQAIELVSVAWHPGQLHPHLSEYIFLTTEC